MTPSPPKFAKNPTPSLENTATSNPAIGAAIIAEGTPEIRTLAEGDAEHRERVTLRSKANLTNYLTAAAAGRLPSGAESELAAAAGVGDGHIPLELWDVAEERADVQTDVPGTVGVNLDPIRPAIFANAILPRIGVAMPRIESGTFASATINQSLTAAALAQGGVAMSTAATFTTTTATPKRISGRLSLQIEDIAAVGVGNFESAVRENLSLVMSDALDVQGLTGDGQAPNLIGNSPAFNRPNRRRLPLFTILTPSPPPTPTPLTDFGQAPSGTL